MFIVLEGIDGGGKSTQIQFLADHVRQRGGEVVCCADPGTTAAGLQIRQLLLNSPEIGVAPTTELLLFFAARAQLIHEVIAPALAAGQVVICDRFLLSSVVYQGHLGQGLGGAGLPSESRPALIWQLGRMLFGSYLPDLTIILDLPVETSLARTQRPLDRIESRGPEYLDQVRHAFLSEAQAQADSLRVVDARQSPAQVAGAIARLFDDLAAKRHSLNPVTSAGTKGVSGPWGETT